MIWGLTGPIQIMSLPLVQFMRNIHCPSFKLLAWLFWGCVSLLTVSRAPWAHPGLFASANNNCPLLSTVLSVAQAAGQILASAASRNPTLICQGCSIPCRDHHSILTVPITGSKTLPRGWGCGSALEHLPSVHKTLGSVPSTGNKHHHHHHTHNQCPAVLPVFFSACLHKPVYFLQQEICSIRGYIRKALDNEQFVYTY